MGCSSLQSASIDEEQEQQESNQLPFLQIKSILEDGSDDDDDEEEGES